MLPFKLAIDALYNVIGKDDNTSHEEGRFLSWLREENAEFKKYTDNEMVAVAFLAGFKVYETNDGYFGEHDYLFVLNNYSLENLIKKWNEEIKDETGYENIYNVKDFIEILYK